jgi:O-antigen/teichoic acid export membrane protein
MQSLYAIASNTAYYVCMFAALFIAPEAIVIVFVNLAVTTITTIISYVRVTATYHPTGENDPAAPRFARHLTIMSVLGLLASQADNLLVFHFLGAATLAIYSITSLLPEKIGGMFKFIATVALPRFTSRTFAEIQASLSKRLIALTILILGIAGLYALIAPTLFRFIYPAYAPNVGYSMLYSLTMLNIVGIFAASALSAHRKIRELYILNVAVPIIQILLQAVAVVVGGLWWLVVAKIVSVFIYSALCVFFVRYAPSNAIQE